jgi:transposase
VGRGRPLFVQEVKQTHADKKVEVWVQDEARIGQQGTLTNVWAETGSRPTAVKQTEYEWAYLFAAVNPVTGASSAMITPTANTQYMNAHLRFISQEAGPQTHVVLVLDQAGWHVAGALNIPDNITLLHLPPYSPELNGTERVWAYLRNHYLSNRVYKDYDEIFDAIKTAWNKLTPDRLASITRTAWISREN